MKKSHGSLKTDVLVVGGGGAACRAALEANMAGAKVILAVKGSFAGIGVRGSGSTAVGVSDRGGPAYPGIVGIQGFDAKNAPPLTPEQDFANIIQLGLGMTDRKLAIILSEQAYEVMRPLVEDWFGEIQPRQWGLHHALEVRNLVLVGEILAKTVQMRKESRGDHYRKDYPDRDDDSWAKVIKVKQKGGNIQLWTEVIDPD